MAHDKSASYRIVLALNQPDVIVNSEMLCYSQLDHTCSNVMNMSGL